MCELGEWETLDPPRPPLRLRRHSPVEWVPMVIVFVVVLAALAVLGAVWASRRRSSEVHSVEGYQNALSTLQTMRAKSNASAVRVLEPGNSHPVRVGGDAEPRGPMPLTLNDTPPGGMVFDDVSRRPGANPPRSTKDYRRRDRSMAVMNRRPRRVGGAIAAGLVVVALVAVLLIIGSSGNHHPSSPPKSSSSSSANHTASAATGTSGGSTAQRSRSKTVSRPKAGATPTSTIPDQFPPTVSTAFSAQYTPPSSSYTLTVQATTGNCWIMVRNAATGSVYVSQTLTPGQQQSVSAQGQSTVVLGAPSVASLTLDGAPVTLPTGARAPFTLTFDPVVSSGASQSPTVTSSSSPAA